jgi:hypothetical protein
MKNRFQWICGATTAVLVVLSILSTWLVLRNKYKAMAAVHDLNECQALADAIVRLRQHPSRAGLAEQSRTDFAHALEEAASCAELPFELITRIDPQAPQRIQNTAYLKQAAQVNIAELSLSQLITMLSTITDGGLHVERIRLIAANDPQTRLKPATAELWNAEVTLTYLIYSAKASNVAHVVVGQVSA